MKFYYQFRINSQAQLASGIADGRPPGFRVRTKRLSLDEGNATVSELEKMFEGKQGSVAVVKNYIGNSGHSAMPRNDDRRHVRHAGKLSGVEGNDALDQAFHKEPLI